MTTGPGFIEIEELFLDPLALMSRNDVIGAVDFPSVVGHETFQRCS